MNSTSKMMSPTQKTIPSGMTRKISHFFCWLFGGHEELMCFDGGKMRLKCMHCHRKTSGFGSEATVG